MVEIEAKPDSKGGEADDLFCYLDRVYAFVARRIGPAQVAEDITSDVLASALSAKRPKGDSLPWLYGIARRKIADVYRRKSVTKESPLEDATFAASAGVHDRMVRDEESAAIRVLVDGLGSDQRDAILLFYVEDMSAGEIGIAMNRSEKAVHSLLQRARQNLKAAGRGLFEDNEKK